jgi:hypothetical protein
MSTNPDREMRSRSGEILDEYIAGGEPGVVVRRCHEIESIKQQDKEDNEK